MAIMLTYILPLLLALVGGREREKGKGDRGGSEEGNILINSKE